MIVGWSEKVMSSVNNSTDKNIETLILVYPISWFLPMIAMHTAYFIARRQAFPAEKQQPGLP